MMRPFTVNPTFPKVVYEPRDPGYSCQPASCGGIPSPPRLTVHPTPKNIVQKKAPIKDQSNIYRRGCRCLCRPPPHLGRVYVGESERPLGRRPVPRRSSDDDRSAVQSLLHDTPEVLFRGWGGCRRCPHWSWRGRLGGGPGVLGWGFRYCCHYAVINCLDFHKR